eukprot:TRINITY_DN4920_c0_g6_i1.p1 TRINITY_DN4920_c0_g6~~TRINITY_DN4920_c0_g6_i1.p1  ORF type:complete len:237 (-),score=65.71 TRINITY_DN4920_c0_g6_i1:849-1559(-)
MIGECTLKEFHCAHKGFHPVRKFPSNDSSQAFSPRGNKRPSQVESHRVGKIHSAVISLNSVPSPASVKSFKKEMIGMVELNGIKRRNFKDSNDLPETISEMPLRIFPKLAKMEDQANSQQFKNQHEEKDLREKLASSLSPSPFRNKDPLRREEKLEQLIASAPNKTKSILLSPFYGNELKGKDSHRAWKIALKDHIVNTFESICLIKKLGPVPNELIEKKKNNIKEVSKSRFYSNW